MKAPAGLSAKARGTLGEAMASADAARSRAVTVRCVTCGLETTGVKDADGFVRASDRSRPEPGAPVERGYCMLHAKWAKP